MSDTLTAGVSGIYSLRPIKLVRWPFVAKKLINKECKKTPVLKCVQNTQKMVWFHLNRGRSEF